MRLRRYFQPETRRELRLKGIPKYFIGTDPILNPKVREIKRWDNTLVLKGYIFDLSLLIRVPKASMNSLSIDSIALDSFKVA